MTKLSCLFVAMLLTVACFSQKYNIDSALNTLSKKKDSTLRAMVHADSLKAEKEFTDKIKWEKLKAVAIYPMFNAGEFSGVIPVAAPTELPDTNMVYKLLFEVTDNNPDSASKEINAALAEVARVVNLHIAAGIPLKKILPVVVVHAGALNAIATNEYYQKKYKTGNPNIKLIDSLANVGTKFIACGQAMAFLDIKKEDLLPLVKVSLTAKTALSTYQLKGYVKM